MAEALSDKPAHGEEKLDDIMLAMDVVDTLRHEQIMVAQDLAAEDRRENLIGRLRGIYKAQGIEVPDSVLMDGVLALEEKRFQFEPARHGVGRRMALLYVNRRRWLPLFYIFAGIIGAVYLINYVGFVRPHQLEVKQAEVMLTETLPKGLETSREAALGLAATDDARARADALYAEGQSALALKDVAAAKAADTDLKQLSIDLAQTYTIRVVSRPDEYSGVFRINDDGGNEVRNYYLIVEGITPAGKRAIVLINSEEDQKSVRAKIWGVRVPEAVFNAVAADKTDDQIIQNAVIGEKKRGALQPVYTVESSGGLILDW